MFFQPLLAGNLKELYRIFQAEDPSVAVEVFVGFFLVPSDDGGPYVAGEFLGSSGGPHKLYLHPFQGDCHLILGRIVYVL